jgi:hypothetical protein
MKIVLILYCFLFPFVAFCEEKEIVAIAGKWVSAEEGKPPASWELIVKENPVVFVIANDAIYMKAEKSSFGFKKEIRFSVKDFPYMTWKWKAIKLPERGDFRHSNCDDQVAQVYVLFPMFPEFLNTRIIGYIWDNEAPRGSKGTSPAWYNIKCIVVRDKTDSAGVWMTEKRKVYEDYKMLFNEEPPSVGGVSIYINSQHTKSSAECEFGFIRFER